MHSLESLGTRIIVLGPSNAGKSTLAVALSRKLDIEAIHLDQFQHLPNTDWKPRPEAEFARLHDDAIMGEHWVMDGNYSRLMPQRLARATGAILITSSRWRRLARYIRRTTVNRSERAGHLEGAQDSIKWDMIDWILFKTQNSATKYADALRRSGLPTVECHTAKALDELYRRWDLPPVR